jgi:KAP family P-loop domain
LRWGLQDIVGREFDTIESLLRQLLSSIAEVAYNADKQSIAHEVSEYLLPTMITSDRYTLKDTLGYQIYAYALARFLTDGRTKAPISISIQASWGGGKTSLMRMVRAMLDEKAPKANKDAKMEDSSKKVALKEIKEKLKESSKEHPEPTRPQAARTDIEPRITVWFNAWKYESTEQVWAGLADSITNGIADRMNRVEREWFYLRLNLGRRNPESIRRWISDRALGYWWQKVVPWIITSIGGIGASMLAMILNFTSFGGNPNISTASLGGVIASGGLGFFEGLTKKLQIEGEPTEVSLGQFVKVPDYK